MSIYFDEQAPILNNIDIEVDQSEAVTEPILELDLSLIQFAHLLHPPLVVWARQKVAPFFLPTRT